MSITATVPLPGTESRLAEMRHVRKIRAIHRSAKRQYIGATLSLLSVIGFIVTTALGALTGYITLIKTDPIVGYSGMAFAQAFSWIYVFSFRYLLRRIAEDRDYLIRRTERAACKRRQQAELRRVQAPTMSQAHEPNQPYTTSTYSVDALSNSATGAAWPRGEDFPQDYARYGYSDGHTATSQVNRNYVDRTGYNQRRYCRL
ncbi:MAG: hypothetical protein PVI21_01185 [Candidatus Woesebacteria bacterium]